MTLGSLVKRFRVDTPGKFRLADFDRRLGLGVGSSSMRPERSRTSAGTASVPGHGRPVDTRTRTG